MRRLILNKSFSKPITAILLSFLSIGIGILGFTLIEDMEFINAVYMTVITISTVGFTEVQELSAEGRIFTSVYIIFNVALFAYLLTIMSTYLFEGKLRDALKSYRSNMELSKLKNHVIVCGFGRNGSRACNELLQSGMQFIVIEKDEEKAEQIPENMKWYVGDATKDADLHAVGIDRASAIIITSPSDSVNVFVTLTARHLNPDIKIITRTSSYETQDKLYHAGANSVVMPDVLGGMFMAHIITKPTVIEFLNLINGVSGLDYHMEENGYESLKDDFKDKTLEDLDITKKTGAVVIGIKDDVKGMIPAPSPSTVVGQQDYLILLGSSANLQSFSETFTR